jgi:hypothetical protein
MEWTTANPSVSISRQFAVASAHRSSSSDCSESCSVNNEAESHIARNHPVICRVDLVNPDLFHPCPEAMLGAEIEHILGLGDATDI